KTLQVAFDGSDHIVECCPCLSLQSSVRAPGFDTLFNGLLMHDTGVQMNDRTIQTARINNGYLILAARAIAISRYPLLDDRFDLRLNWVFQLAVVPHA